MTIYQAVEVAPKLAEAFQRLMPQLNPSSRIPNQQELQEIIDTGNTFLFIGEVNGEIIGVVSLVFYKIPTGDKAWIEDVVVEEAARGKGYGKMLVSYAVDFAKSKGFFKINLTSNPARLAANTMYKQLGFKQYVTNVYRLDV